MSDQPATAKKGLAHDLAPGLYLVATPIGAARDITLRALDVLAGADAIAAEDTRTARKLMEIHGVAVAGRPLLAYHDHSKDSARTRVLRLIEEGKSVAYVSEAGTPLVADPGYQLARAAIAEGLPVTTAPGASAAIAALCLSGLPSDRFLFAGFAPQSRAALKTWVAELAPIRATLILYESPRRIHKLLDVLADGLGGDRRVAICRELTKHFEEVLRGSIDDLRDRIADRALKGEIVVVIDKGDAVETDAETLDDALRQALVGQSVKDAAAMVAAATGLPKRQVYQAALQLSRQEDET
ncbi:16S rRNA (cytidine(1402)-2'-O)-methyltransferase [Alterinioella nitratireducens]|uniref:16S rRNA (cytidine(1402)-2'-O)-methyltransferase n=1 Tax=Alterinioella nitratireducens TaxID=2735915 RepID=UPI0015532781|nr:16S rRNA (cytidine(1402)-2'-O)-methyltransferase [Alterinioella nitratireducens]NPD19423.1 16S rRNA (cytidine(1402)-2'-O)-methyltransferase [Alterinioella nitratireducens]